MKPLCLTVIAALLLFAALPTAASPTTGTISTQDRYAWGENLGWVNLSPSNAGLIITDSSVTGYAWSRQFGWINFNPSSSGQGVSNSPTGVLSGSAWVAQRGWLNFDGVTIDNDGRFHGVAGTDGSSVGRVSFDCSSCIVITDWRPARFREQNSPTNSSRVTPRNPETNPIIDPSTIVPEPPITPVITPTAPATTAPTQVAVNQSNLNNFNNEGGEGVITSYNEAITIAPLESGTLYRDFENGLSARIDIVSGASASGFSVDVRPIAVDFRGYDASIKAVGDYFFDIIAYSADGKPVYTFNAPLKVTLPLAPGTDVVDLGVYWLDEATGVWHSIPAAFAESSVSFYTDHLARFAILSAPGQPELIMPVPSRLRALILYGIPALVLLAGLAFGWGIKKPKMKISKKVHK